MDAPVPITSEVIPQPTGFNPAGLKWPIVAILSFILGVISVLTYQKLQPSRIIPEGPSPSPMAVLPAPLVDPAAGWKTFSVGGEFPLTFQYPNNLNAAGKNVGGESYHIFISPNAISVPDMWDSPITQIELDYSFSNQRNYEKMIQNSIAMITPETIKQKEMIINQLKITQISGTVGPGYMESEKITYVIIDTPKGPISLNYFQSLFKDQKQISELELNQIVSSFKFTD